MGREEGGPKGGSGTSSQRIGGLMSYVVDTTEDDSK